MSNSNDTLNEDTFGSESGFMIPFYVRFWLFLFSNLLSILCYLFVLYHLLFIRILRQALNNHVIIVLLWIDLIYELTDISFILHYYRLDGTWQITPSFSQFWSYIDIGFYTAQLIIFAWATIERHILIFHDRWLIRKWRRFFFHYFPLTILLLYCLIYYSLIIFYPFCEYLNYQSRINGVFMPCMYLNPIFSKWDLVGHQIVPTFIIIIFSVSLLLRVLWKKTRLNQVIQWRKQRKLTIQVLSISTLYLCFQFPWTFFQFCYLVGLPVDSARNAITYAYFVGYYVGFVFPFVCCGSLPELKKKIKRILCCQRQQRLIFPR